MRYEKTNESKTQIETSKKAGQFHAAEKERTYQRQRQSKRETNLSSSVRRKRTVTDPWSVHERGRENREKRG